MLTLALFMLVGTTTFVEEPIPDIGELPGSPGGFEFSDGRAWGLPQADLDGDGTMDLLLSKGVIFLRGGHYTAPMPLPTLPEDKRPVVQLWGKDLYLRFPDRLEIVAWENGAWQKKSAQPVDWPKPDPAFQSDEPEEDSDEAVRFGDFLHDIDGDGVPEIALALKDGLHFFARRGEAYEAVGVLNVYPSPRPERNWQFTGDMSQVRRMYANISLRGSALTVFDTETLSLFEVRIHITYYALKMGDKEISAEVTRRSVTAPMPDQVSAARLNQDDILDFVSEDRDAARALPVPFHVLVLGASTDEGKTLQLRRTTGIPYHVDTYFDVDGDNDQDMVVQRSGMFDGGMRELVSRAFTDNTIKHRVDIYLQDAQGRFSSNPDRTWQGEIRLDATFVQDSTMCSLYQEFGLVRLGDFNKDGRMDVAVQDRPDRIAVYLATADGFESKVETTVPALPGKYFEVNDMDGDGRADIVTKDRPGARVYFSREGQP